MPASVGSLPFACIVTAHRPTAGQLAGDNVPTSSTAGQLAGDNVPSSSMVPSTILPSTQVTGRTEADFMAPSCIGVRIRLRGQTFLTATSHGFVHLDRLGLSNDVSVPQEKQELEAILYPPMEPSPSRLARLRTFIAHRLLRQRPQKTETPVQRPKTSTVNKILSPVGVTVYAEGSGLVLGRVVKTYDQLPAQTAHYLNLFPFGFPHNLSLIAAIDEQHPLPKMVIPTWYPMIGPRFANPQSALHQESFAHPPIISMWDRIIGKVPPPPSTPAFLWQHNSLLRKRRQWRLGRVACEATKAVLICGADYLFEAEHVQRSLIWRTERDDLSLAGSSGSVLCLGRPEDSQAQAIVFQNFETPISPKQLKTTRETYAGIPEGFTYKGGFFLPSEILNESIIEMTQATDIATSHSYNSDKDWTKLKSMPTSRSALLNYFRARKSCKEL
ncbi:hypothetical protein C8R45DRAFT_1045655 [Mycena sanguinolenta]|nr:hypothetical protein C8R45DRAFT_1045655 [Mycena sanguinolenta]